MFYVIPDTLLKMSLNTNKTGHHDIRYTWHIVESLVKHQKNWSPCYTWHIVESVVNTNKTGHHVIRYTWHIFESGAKQQ